MSTTFQQRLLTALLIPLALAAFPALTYASHSWGTYHWARTSNPFTLKLGDNVSGAWNSSLVTTSFDWTESTVLNTSIVLGNNLSNLRRCPPTSGRVEVCATTYGNNGWLGVASIWISGLHITRGTVKLNNTYFNTTKYNTTAWKNLVMCQEVGHTLGLDHQDVVFTNSNLGTCMDYTNNPAGNEHPNQHDYDQLVTIYTPHTDSTTTVAQTATAAQMPPAMAGNDFETPAQWGRLTRLTNNGRTALFELDLGRGHKLFTFVILAEGGQLGPFSAGGARR